jgi:hypothetical protein
MDRAPEAEESFATAFQLDPEKRREFEREFPQRGMPGDGHPQP